MTMPLIFRAMTKQRDGLLLRQMLKQPQGELLSVVFDSLVSRIYAAGFLQFFQVASGVFRPRNFAGEDCIAQLFARPEIRHPDIESIRGQTATSSSRDENPKSVARLDWAMN